MILLTPTADVTQALTYEGADETLLADHAEQIRTLAAENGIGLADSFAVCQEYVKTGVLSDILSSSNHPNRNGHELVAAGLLRWFPAA